MSGSHVRIATIAVLAMAILWLGAPQGIAGPMPGAIYTTDENGEQVNSNLFEAKEDVYFAGGPPPNAPPDAAGLDEGDYYFQVTDPSGKKLLSEDCIQCRKFHVNEHGVIDAVYPATCMVKVKGQMTEVDCTHKTGIDQDHWELGAITIQLMPYKDTPNNGGVYKLWVTPVEKYDTGGGGVFGFIPAWSKTDNYKVRKNGNGPVREGSIEVHKYHDANANCVIEYGTEAEVTGWAVDVTDPLNVTNTYYTPFRLDNLPEGTYTVKEVGPTPVTWIATCSYLDFVLVACYQSASQDDVKTVTVQVEEGAVSYVEYGNVGVGDIEAYKFYDRDMNGSWDTGEPPIQGWRITLDAGDPVETDADGLVTFAGLVPGTYTVAELMAGTGNPDTEWVSTTPESVLVTVSSVVVGATIVPVVEWSPVFFGNVCRGYGGEADFDTKGYWHNKNGLAELMGGADGNGDGVPDSIDYVNGLDPYDSPSSYFDAGDEPFNGYFQDGVTPVAAVNGEWGSEIAGEGTWQAEVSAFLIDPNAGGDPREQLAQQLLAFIFNTIHRLEGLDPAILNPHVDPPEWVSVADLIDAALAAWQTPGVDDDGELAGLLDHLNNCDAVPYQYTLPEPCGVVYP